MKKFIIDFKEFLKEYKVISLAIAFVMGTAATSLVNSLVNDIFMPLIGPLISASGVWKSAILHMGKVHITYGAFFAQLINFLIIALIIFVVVRIFFKEDSKK
jgi:large conductance mechanosensitive channel